MLIISSGLIIIFSCYYLQSQSQSPHWGFHKGLSGSALNLLQVVISRTPVVLAAMKINPPTWVNRLLMKHLRFIQMPKMKTAQSRFKTQRHWLQRKTRVKQKTGNLAGCIDQKKQLEYTRKLTSSTAGVRTQRDGSLIFSSWTLPDNDWNSQQMVSFFPRHTCEWRARREGGETPTCIKWKLLYQHLMVPFITFNLGRWLKSGSF